MQKENPVTILIIGFLMEISGIRTERFAPCIPWQKKRTDHTLCSLSFFLVEISGIEPLTS